MIRPYYVTSNPSSAPPSMPSLPRLSSPGGHGHGQRHVGVGRFGEVLDGFLYAAREFRAHRRPTRCSAMSIPAEVTTGALVHPVRVDGILPEGRGRLSQCAEAPRIFVTRVGTR